MHRTWIRVEDEFGQFDWPKDQDLPQGVKPVKDYPEHVGTIARDGKPKTASKGGTKSPDSGSGTGKTNTDAGAAGKESE